MLSCVCRICESKSPEYRIVLVQHPNWSAHRSDMGCVATVPNGPSKECHDTTLGIGCESWKSARGPEEVREMSSSRMSLARVLLCGGNLPLVTIWQPCKPLYLYRHITEEKSGVRSYGVMVFHHDPRAGERVGSRDVCIVNFICSCLTVIWGIVAARGCGQLLSFTTDR